jgi:hypothetical protein
LISNHHNSAESSREAEVELLADTQQILPAVKPLAATGFKNTTLFPDSEPFVDTPVTVTAAPLFSTIRKVLKETEGDERINTGNGIINNEEVEDSTKPLPINS